jgi:hypothetical protein
MMASAEDRSRRVAQVKVDQLEVVRRKMAEEIVSGLADGRTSMVFGQARVRVRACVRARV